MRACAPASPPCTRVPPPPPQPPTQHASTPTQLTSITCFDPQPTRPPTCLSPHLPPQIENPLLRRAAKVGAAYRAALRPRLLVLVGLAGLVAAYNAAAPEPLPLVYEGCVLGGFLSYKVALLVKLADDLTPKVTGDGGGVSLTGICGAGSVVRGARRRQHQQRGRSRPATRLTGELCPPDLHPLIPTPARCAAACTELGGQPAGGRGLAAPTFLMCTPLIPASHPLAPRAQSFEAKAARPVIEQVEDELDQWGRPKKRIGESPLAVMPESERIKAEAQLEAQLAKEERRRRGGGGEGPDQQ